MPRRPTGDATRVVTLLALLAASWMLAAPAASFAAEAPAAVAPTVRFEAPAGATITLGNGHRFVGTIEVRAAPGGGLTVVDDLGIEDYVAGVDEMPARWPMAALEAQAIAVRTYAWYQARLGTFERRGLGYDVCASTACQRFRGRAVVEQPFVGQRWQQAVDATAGQVLLFDGAPALTRYFSSSGGRTRDNEDVFGGPSVPYLRGVDDPADAIAPLHHWSVTFGRDQFDAILAHGEQLAAVTPVADVRRITTDGAPDRIRVTGLHGTVVEVGASDFRSFVSTVAPQLFPGDFPGRREDGGRLPTTLPSSRIDVTVTADAVVVDGAGFGHGVGMSQWGADGMAQDGADAAAILAHYYGGLAPVRAPGLPDTMRVGWDGGDEVTVTADRPLTIEAAGTPVTARGMGTWTVRSASGGQVRLVPPDGYGATLQIADAAVSRSAPTRLEVVTIRTAVNKPSQLHMDIARPDGTAVLDRDLGIVVAGPQEVRWDLDDAHGDPVPAGRYDVRLTAVDETGAPSVSGARVDVQDLHVPAARAASLLPASPTGRPGTLPAALAGLLAGLVVGVLVPVREGQS